MKKKQKAKFINPDLIRSISLKRNAHPLRPLVNENEDIFRKKISKKKVEIDELMSKLRVSI